MSPGIWSYVVWRVGSIVLKDHGTCLFLEEAGFFETLRMINPVTQCHIPEDFALQPSGSIFSSDTYSDSLKLLLWRGLLVY